jgi:hypothetical protein
MKKLLNINDWNNYIYIKKKELINYIDKNNSLDKSNDTLIFNNIIKDVININIFNMSYIAFMTLKFLETSFIPSEIILNAINIYNDCEVQKINNNINDEFETFNYIKILKYIINIIIDFVIKIEIILNLKLLLIIHFINKVKNEKINKNITNITNSTNAHNAPNEITSNIYKIFTNINTNIINHITPSTLILLFLKLISKLNNNDYDDDNEILHFLNENENKQTLNIQYNYNTKKKLVNKKTKQYLDTFMLDITKYFFEDSNPDIYIICTKYIFNNVELIFNNFENIFSILEYHLLKSKNINENKKIKLSYLRNVIKNLIEIEIDKINKLLFIK